MKKNNIITHYAKKGALLIALSLLFSSISFSQSNTEEIDMVQSMFGMEKKQAVAEILKLESSDPFWVIYDEYETKRKELGKKRFELLKNYVENYDSLTDEKTDELVKEAMSQNKEIDKLISTYYNKVKKQNGSKVSAQFYQLENFIYVATRSSIMDEIPFIGELE